MKQLDLGPDDYRKRGNDGRWHLPDDPKLARLMFFAMLAVLVFIFLNRDVVSSAALFVGAAIPAAIGGIMFAIWLKNVY